MPSTLVSLTTTSRIAALALGVVLLGCTHLNSTPLASGTGGGAGTGSAGAGGAGRGSAGATSVTGVGGVGAGVAGDAGASGVGGSGGSGGAVGSAGSTAGSGGSTATGGAGGAGGGGASGGAAGGAGGGAGTMNVAGASGAAGAPLPCEGRCSATQTCNTKTDRCALKGGPCDQPPDDLFLFCDDFENGDINTSLWGSTYSNQTVLPAAAHTGSGGLQIVATGGLGTRLHEFAAYGYPIRVSFWMSPTIGGQYNDFLTMRVIGGTDFELGSYSSAYRWVNNFPQTFVVPDLSKTVAVAQRKWTCVDLLFTDDTTVVTTIQIAGQSKVVLPTITAYEFNLSTQYGFSGPPSLGPLSYGTMFVDDFMVTLDDRSACPK
jgi:hypothetical protein